MTERPGTLARVSAFAGLPRMHTTGGGVNVIDRDGIGIASVLVKKGRTEALVRRVRERYYVELPLAPRRANAGEVAFIAAGPQTWLATSDQGAHTLPSSLRQMLGDLASISDQSSGYAVLRLTGPRVRETLAKLIPIDIHPRAFPVGMAAVTVAAHIGVTLWRLEDEAGRSATFELALYRSMAGSFWHALSESAAQFGLALPCAEPTLASASGLALTGSST